MQGLKEMGLLDQFRFVVDEFQTLFTDAAFRGDVEAEFMENLQYISSAGLRVLLIIKKSLPGNELILHNVNETVEEILDTTGFSDLFTVVAE
jgi:anti-sigma B factor antagonist